jgi:hypothetical protein
MKYPRHQPHKQIQQIIGNNIAFLLFLLVLNLSLHDYKNLSCFAPQTFLLFLDLVILLKDLQPEFALHIVFHLLVGLKMKLVAVVIACLFAIVCVVPPADVGPQSIIGTGVVLGQMPTGCEHIEIPIAILDKDLCALMAQKPPDIVIVFPRLGRINRQRKISAAQPGALMAQDTLFLYWFSTFSLTHNWIFSPCLICYIGKGLIIRFLAPRVNGRAISLGYFIPKRVIVLYDPIWSPLPKKTSLYGR